MRTARCPDNLFARAGLPRTTRRADLPPCATRPAGLRVRLSGAIWAAGWCALSLCGLPGAACAQSGSAPPPAAPSAPPVAGAEKGLLAQMSRELSALVLQSRDGVVSIQGHRALSAQEALFGPMGGGGSRFAPPTPLFAAASDRPLYVRVIGSGFLVQGDLVVTTAEVAEDIVGPSVILADGRSLRVLAKSLNRESNLAVFKVARPSGVDSLRALRLGDATSVLPGSLALTIGNQAGFAGSSGLAFIAKVDRHARSGARLYSNLIQFQGAVGPGSSGGPLLDMNGDVVGMVIATPDVTPGWYGETGSRERTGSRDEQAGRRHAEGERADKPGHSSGLKAHKSQAGGETGRDNTPAARGGDREAGASSEYVPPSGPRRTAPGMFGGLSSMGFALPINTVRGDIDALAGRLQAIPTQGWMGLHAENGPLPGAYVTNLYDGSPADRGGLEVGDIITHVDGRPIRSNRDFFEALIPAVEGQTLRLQVQRSGTTRTLPIRLSGKPDADAVRRMTQRVTPGVGMSLLFCPPIA